MIRNIAKATAFAALATGLYAAPAIALEKINVAIGQRGLWDTLPTVFAQENGYFKELGLDIHHIRTRGGAETARVVMTGDMQFGMTIGVLGAISAYAKGGPVRIVASEMKGVPDLFWYVRADSKLKTVKDINGAQIGYSRPGSSTNLTLLTLATYLNLKPILVSTGGPSGSRTQMMSGQTDAAWSVPPLGLDLINSGKARILFKGSIVKPLSDLSIRVNIVNSNWLAKNRGTARKFLMGYSRALNWMYGSGKEEAIKRFAKGMKLPVDIARIAVDFYNKENNAMLPISNIDKAIALAVQHKRIKKPLTAAQKAELVQIVYDPRKK